MHTASPRPRRLSLASVVLVVIVASLSFGYTSCDRFTTVTVPSTDSTAPMVVHKILLGGGPEQVVFDGAVIDVPDLDTQVTVVPAMLDTGGARRLTLERYARVSCSGDGLGQIVNVDMGPVSDQQTGGPGSRVSNGIFLLETFRMREFDLCGGGFELDEVRYGWLATGTDFHNNRSRASLTLVYTP